MIPHVPQLHAQAVMPDDALIAAYLADDPTEFYRLIAERETSDDVWTEDELR